MNSLGSCRRIPAWIGSLSGLQHLLLSKTQLTGPIPDSISELSTLQWLDLGNNQLTGPIPHSIYELITLQKLDLAGNQLTGSMPPESLCLGLLYCDCSGNSLSCMNNSTCAAQHCGVQCEGPSDKPKERGFVGRGESRDWWQRLPQRPGVYAFMGLLLFYLLRCVTSGDAGLCYSQLCRCARAVSRLSRASDIRSIYSEYEMLSGVSVPPRPISAGMAGLPELSSEGDDEEEAKGGQLGGSISGHTGAGAMALADLGKFAQPLTRLVVLRLLKQLATVYHSVKIDHFLNLVKPLGVQRDAVRFILIFDELITSLISDAVY